MSTRFYICGTQIFGNNEMFENTFKELCKQLSLNVSYEDFYEQPLDNEIISDPDSLLLAIEKDTINKVKTFASKDVDLFFDSDKIDQQWLISCMQNFRFCNHPVLFNLCMFLDSKYVMMPYLAYNAMKDRIRMDEYGRYVLRDGKVVTISWY